MSATPVLAASFARDVHAGLSRDGQKSLPCGYLYDDVGSALFEAITVLPEYGLARADARILTEHAPAMAARIPGRVTVVELGSGSGVKTRAILQALAPRGPMSYYPIDLSRSALAKCKAELSPFAYVNPIHANYTAGLARAVAARAPEETLLVLFLGSTIGNFEPDAAAEFLYAVRAQLQPGDALLLGTDLVKSVDSLLAAYDDPAGVTAAFNRNLLSRINRKLGADFDLRAFEHMARYCPESQRIEMHLCSLAGQSVQIPAAALTVDFLEGETILTEVCYKFRPEQIQTLARAAGFHLEAQWQDEEWPFAESLLR